MVSFLSGDEPLPKPVLQMMLRLFLDDAACNFFFMNYGGCKFQSARATEVRLGGAGGREQALSGRGGARLGV